MASLEEKISFENIAEFRSKFEKYATPDSDKMNISNFDDLMKECDEQVPQFKLRKIVCERKAAGKCEEIDFNEFLDIFTKLSTKTIGARFKQAIETKDHVNVSGGSSASAQGTKHSILDAENEMFTSWINTCLGDDKSLKAYLPINNEENAIFKAIKDGVVLCKMINWATPNTIDERVMNTKKLTVYTMHENQTLALNSAMAIGCNIVNIGASDLVDGKQHLVLGLIWQIIRIGLFNRINVKNCPGITALLEGDETVADVNKLSPEEIVLRWVNFHIRETGYSKVVKNFSEDIKDSEVYSILLKQIAPPGLDLDEPHIMETELQKRAERVLENAKQLGCNSFVRPRDIVDGNPKLNLAFVCNLFNSHPSLKFDENETLSDIDETREEKTLRNWINSLGVKPHIHHLYFDLSDGIALAQLFDQIHPGIVNWKSVNMPPFPKLSGKMKKLENCNYVVKVADELKFSVVGIGGQDIIEGNKKYILSIVSQAMHFYTLSLLQSITGSDKPVKDEEIIKWVNEKLQEHEKSSKISNFKDPTISSSQSIIDLIDSIKPKSVYYAAILTNDTEEAKFSNAKFAISMARKVGARIYALPEDVVEVNPKMVMTIFACLMASGLQDK